MKEDKGYVMVLALVIASALLILLSTITGTIIIQRRLVDRSYHRERALGLAESGIDVTVAYLNEKNLSKPELLTGNIAGMGEFEIRVVSSDDTITLTSTGYSKQKDEGKSKAQRTILVIANLTMEGTIFEYAIASGGDITIEEATIEGDVAAVSFVYNSGNVTGTITEGAELEFPEFDSDYYLANADTVKSEDPWKIEDETDYPINGIVYVKGDVEIKESTLIGPGVIVAEGEIKVEAGENEITKVGTSLAPVGLISISDEEEAIKIEGKTEDEKDYLVEMHGILWAPYGEIKIEKNSTIYGSVVSGGSHKIEDGSSKITHCLDFNNEFYKYFKGNYLITSWSEIL